MALQLSTIIDNTQEAISDLRNYHHLSQPLVDLRWEAVYNLKTALDSLKKLQKELEQNEDEEEK